MMADKTYTKAFLAAILLHFIIAALLIFESSTNSPVLREETKIEDGKLLAEDKSPEPDIVKAVSVDKQEVIEAVNRLKQEKVQAAKAEAAKQQALQQQLQKAREARVLEQKHLAQLKKEADAIALKRKKEMEEEQKHLKQLAEEKKQEAKKLEQLKKEQEALKKQQKLAAEQMQKAKAEAALKEKQQAEKQQAEKRQAEKLAAEQAASAKTAADKAEKARAQALEAAEAASQRAKMMGEVDKYKALIKNAISQRWILPDNVDSGLYSQFRIRLAPDGAVLQVSLTRSSGDPILDRSAENAIQKASPLPVPSDPATFDQFRDISLTVRPENVRG